MIKPIDKIIVTDGVHNVGIETYNPKQVEQLEADFKEAIEALKKVQLFAESSYNTEISTTYYKKIIERLTGEEWEDFKEIN